MLAEARRNSQGKEPCADGGHSRLAGSIACAGGSVRCAGKAGSGLLRPSRAGGFAVTLTYLHAIASEELELARSDVRSLAVYRVTITEHTEALRATCGQITEEYLGSTTAKWALSVVTGPVLRAAGVTSLRGRLDPLACAGYTWRQGGAGKRGPIAQRQSSGLLVRRPWALPSSNDLGIFAVLVACVPLIVFIGELALSSTVRLSGTRYYFTENQQKQNQKHRDCHRRV